MGQRRSKLDRHAAELLALRRAGATVAQLTRWLRLQRDAIVAATTVGRWLENAPSRGGLDLDLDEDFDAVAARDDHGLWVDRSTVSRWLRKHTSSEA